MTDILDNVDSDSSENEDISRLFPRYKPKIPNDFNLNKVSEEESPSHFLAQLEKNGNDSNVECEANGISDGSPTNVVQTNSDCQKQDHVPYEEDCSVVSAYGMYGINCSKHEDVKSEIDLKNSTESDVVSKYENALTFQEFKLRESRIEMAGGREVFSSTRIRYPRKRFSDEILHNSTSLESKCNDDKRSTRLSKCREVNCADELALKSTQRTVCQLRSEWEKSSQDSQENKETVVYETDIDGLEVIYDDIGDWVDRTPSVSENLSHLKLESECSSSSLHDTINSFCKPLTVSTEALNSEDETSSPIICSPVRKYLTNKSSLSPSRQMDGFVNEISDDKCTVLIGSLPIAEYEGSPRRYGPRPGHPERIVYHEEKEKNLQNEDGEILRLTKSNKMYDVNTIQTDNPEIALQFDYLLRESQHEKNLRQIYEPEVQSNVDLNNSYIGRRLARLHGSYVEDSPKRGPTEGEYQNLVMDSLSKTHFDDNSYMTENNPKSNENVVLAPMDEDRETISTNPDTEDLGETEMGEQVGQSRNFTLSPETTDCESNDVESEVSFENDESVHSDSHACGSMPVLEDGLSSGQASDADEVDMETESVVEGRRHHCVDNPTALLIKKQISEIEKEISRRAHKKMPLGVECEELNELISQERDQMSTTDITLDFLDPLRNETSYSIANECDEGYEVKKDTVDEAIKEIKQAILKTKAMPLKTTSADNPAENDKPVWVPRPLYNQQKIVDDTGNKVHSKNEDGQDEECDTDQETDRLLGKQRTDDKGFFEDKVWCKQNSVVMSNCSAAEECESLNDSSDVEKSKTRKDKDHRKKGRSKEVLLHEPGVLIEGVLFRARYLGSTQLVCEGQPTKATRMMQAEEAVSRIKAPEGENQPSTEVDLFISTEKIMVLNTDLKEIMMDHSLRTISYIADIGDLVVLMARRRLMSCQEDQEPKIRRTPKMICHVFESEEAQFIAQSIGQAFQVAYMEFLKANGIEDHSFVKEMDYQEVLNSQEIYGDELEMFAKKEMQKEVIVPKARGEMLGVVIVESGWGSMLPTVVIANLSPSGAAARCGQLNIGDQIIAINGISLVGLPLSTCQNYIKNAKTQMVVKLTVVPCAPVVEVKIKRPDTKYQLGFSVQNGVICSLLRGGIAERGGVRVGHRIIEINGQSVVAVPHERIVNLLATSVGEILMKTMPTSMFRLLTGQETPVYI